MIGPGTAAEQALRASAVAEAADLFAHHGDAAVELLIARIHDPDLSPADRRRYRLTRLEVERLGRARRQAWSPTALAVWQPPLFSWGGIKKLFGRKSKGTSRRRGR
ncbi:MAG: hypothetical protein JWL91_1564 [Sphingomonas bacterium]|jgi:hypothetical protein|nr:hypothetical protein [Sphingomonas bacterium]MDB5689688.1 hypothetical protein [Sphingomonas bacterium]